MKIATWNVNSIRARKDRVLAWLDVNPVDVLCMQETKTVDGGFPFADFSARGYHVEHWGTPAYNGVAIASKLPLAEVMRGLDANADPQARCIAATISGVRVMCVYVPNGEAPQSAKFVYKLAWLDRLLAVMSSSDLSKPLLLCGDFNVAPEPIDVHDPALWEGNCLFHPDERARLEKLRSLGLVDVYRAQHVGEADRYTWWDYRMLGFQRNQGLRIDHVYASAPAAARVTRAEIDREARKGKGASDHAPVVVELA